MEGCQSALVVEISTFGSGLRLVKTILRRAGSGTTYQPVREGGTGMASYQSLPAWINASDGDLRAMRPVLERIGMPDSNSRGRLRVIGGALRGRRIDTLPGESIRPTGDRVREALFDILGNQVHDSAFLDIYAGTGAIGIEALSRGAREVTFIENDPAAAELIRKNLSLAGAASTRVRVIDRDPEQAVALLQREDR